MAVQSAVMEERLKEIEYINEGRPGPCLHFHGDLCGKGYGYNNVQTGTNSIKRDL